MSTNIEWCDEVWNPTTGCTKGCSYCYARPIAEKRLKNNPLTAHQYRNGFAPTCHPERLSIPFKWKKPRRIFVNSMGDLFDGSIPEPFIDKVFAMIALASIHTFMVLTKNPDRMERYFADPDCLNNIQRQIQEIAYDSPKWGAYHSNCCPPPNAWLGVSVTNEKESFSRINTLARIPATSRFVSVEPILDWCHMPMIGDGSQPWGHFIHWVICGPQSGPARIPAPMAAIISLQDQCSVSDVPFFLKGLGERGPKEFPR